LRWIEGDTYREVFDTPGAHADAMPDPDFLVAFAIGRECVFSHRFSWADSGVSPDAELLAAMERDVRKSLQDRPQYGARSTW